MPPAALTSSRQSSKPRTCASDSSLSAPVFDAVKPMLSVSCANAGEKPRRTATCDQRASRAQSMTFGHRAASRVIPGRFAAKSPRASGIPMDRQNIAECVRFVDKPIGFSLDRLRRAAPE